MVLYHTVSALLLVGFLSLMFHGSVRNEIESALGQKTTYNKILSYFGYVVIVATVAYLWPISLIVVAIVALVLWGINHDFSRR